MDSCNAKKKTIFDGKNTSIKITVLDKNDSPPSFKDTPLIYSVSEDLSVGQPVATLRAIDPDTIGQLKYSLEGGDEHNHFTLDSNTGVLQLKDTLDRETQDTYKLRVRVSDTLQYTDTIVIVMVTDTNDNPPVFSENAYSFDIPEDSVRGARVGQIIATDPDQGVNSQLTYTVISDWANDVFSLNPQTGIFTLTARLDYEEVQHYILVVQAQDSGTPSLSSTLTVYCNVVDLNDNAPIFDPMSYSNEIYENVTIGTSVVTVSATDLDSGDNGKITYAILSGDEKHDFQILSNGTIFTKRQLDRETQAIYNLVVTATDQAKPPQKQLSSTVQVTIILKDINDMAPEFISSKSTTVSENITPNTVIMSVKAIDKDEGRNGYIEYTLVDDTNGVFALGSVDGLLRVAGRIDRELRANYSLFIIAKDRGEPPLSTNTTIFVQVLDENDNSPVFDPKQYSASIAENASIGASVLQVSATDIDEGLNGRVRFSISSGDTNRDFSIAEDSGVVRVAKNLNYERKSRYLLTVRAEDCAGDISGGEVRSDVAELSISVSDINDNPPTFLDSPYIAYVMENIIPPNGGYVITVEAYDADSPPFNSLVRYFIKEGDTDIFRINASTGEISLLRALDREVQEEYVLSLVAMDTGSPPLTGTGIVRIIIQDVNDHSPEFEWPSYKATVKENLPKGTWIITPKATDRDSGLNAKIRYSLLGDKVERFHVNQDDGTVTTAVELDREETDVYYLTLMAQDCSTTEPRVTTVNLTITVLDDNDNSPVFSSSVYTVSVPDRTQAGQFVFGAKAVDADINNNSKLVYSLSGPDIEKFTINKETGVIRATEELSLGGLGRGKLFEIQIKASDSGIEKRSAVADLKIHLKPAHLFPSFTTPIEHSLTLPEDISEGQVIAKISATSPKKAPSGIVRYAIAGGNIGDAISIDSVTGEVQVTGRGLDYETSPYYEVWIEAKDSDNPALRSVQQMIINVTDANDNAPIMEYSVYNATVMEEEIPPVFIIKIVATDADTNENGQISYELVDDFDGAFEMNPESGEIYTNMRLDREEISNYDLVVHAIDQGSPQLTGTATVLVSVLDKNDNPPRFTRLFSVNVTENADIGSFVIRVTSSDQDEGENANATYSFTENPGKKFAIDPVSGNVTVIGSLDREQQDEYLLKVAADDGSWRSETPLTITIQDQNDNTPEFEHSYYSFNFPEMQPSMVFVGQVSATDRDKQGPNSVISYSLQQPSDLFTIDPATGDVFSKRTLQYKYSQMESSPENIYALTVLATDNGKPPMSSECLVTINVVDANNNQPHFEQKQYLAPVPKGSRIGQKIIKIVAKDELDFGVNAEVEYNIGGGNSSDYFTIDKNSGWVSLIKQLPEVGTTYVMKVRATDRGVPPQHDEATVTIIVTGENKHGPVFTALSYQVIVPENEPLESTIVTVSASDEDEGPNGMIRYRISGGNERKEFAVDSVTGAVTILQPLDYDTVPEYKLNITAEDLGFDSRHTTAMLTVTLTDINDNAPTFNQTSYEVYLAENSPPKSFVCRLFATDIDSPKNAIIEYSVVGGSGKDLFMMEPKTGIISSRISFDFEEKNVYDLDILAANPDSVMYGSTKVIVQITGVNEYYPRFIQPVFHFDVSESALIGTQVGVIQATDQDAGDDGKVYYLFVGSSNDKGFTIGAETGIIKISRNLDRETQNRVVLTVMAKNAGGIRGNDTDEAQVIISIQDGNDPPEFLQTLYKASVSEGASYGTRILTVKAVDKDVRPQNNQFSYSIIGGNIDQVFKIDPQTGDVETSRELDRETIPVYNLIVGAIDTGIPPQTGSATIQITLTDINDNGPIFDPPNVTGYVMENQPPFTKVMTLTATDPDLPPNGAPFSYYLVGGRHKDMVIIEKHTGVVKTTKSLDRESIPMLDIIVEVEDSGTPKMRSRHHVTITVLDENDSPSTSRSVHVIVHAFSNTIPIGKIADVHPNDADITGEYRCKILQAPVPNGVLTIPSGCDLHTSQITPNQGYSLSVSGNDGKHADVISKVTLEFLSFDNITIDNSITVRITNMTASHFLTNFYNGILDLWKTCFDSGDSIKLTSIYENSTYIDLTVAVEQSSGKYRSKSYVIERLLKKKPTMKNMFKASQSVTIGYTPCQIDTCKNDGICTEAIKVHGDTRITDSNALIFTSPLVIHEFSCHCTDGFTGQYCHKRQDPCSPNPCKAGGQCRRQGFEFQCICPVTREGRYCEQERGDACSENPCKNGGSCRESPDGSSFFCLCRPGYRGNQCEAVADSCRPNPCLYGGLCISLKPGYNCSCIDGRYGRHCEKGTFGFNELSYMKFPALDAATNDISLIFATTKPNALLIYNYGIQSGGRSDFVAMELINGKAIFSFGGARTAITSVSVSGKTGSLSDGTWHKVTATRNGRVVSLSVASCTEHGDSCEDCRPGDTACYADEIGPTGTLNFNNQPLLVGGLSTADPVLERPGQIHSDDLVGCVHSISVNGRSLNLSNPIESNGVQSTCSRHGNCKAAPTDPCGGFGSCLDHWQTLKCKCDNRLIAPNCNSALQPISLIDGGFIEFKISQKHKRMQLLENIYRGSTNWHSHHHRNERSTPLLNDMPAKTISLMFRTIKLDGVLIYAASNKHYTSVGLRNGELVYTSRFSTSVNMSSVDLHISDGKWHNLTLHSKNRGLHLFLDGNRVGDELDTAGVHDFLDPYLTVLTLGGINSRINFNIEDMSQNFEGCFANFTINNEVQPFNGSGSVFNEVLTTGKVLPGCQHILGVGAAVSPDPLSIGITLVIVFFVVLLVAILVSFIVFRLRRQKKEKSGAPGCSSGMHVKQNGGNAIMSSSNLVSLGPDGVLVRPSHTNETSVAYLENGDVIRGVSGHHIIAPELISKKYKEREIPSNEHRPQRPDIIEREVVGKSPPMREDHHPPIPPSSAHVHDHVNTDLNSELPEHYDLENASSIAPSDIDIVYHYKGYREAGGVRKYKATPPPVTTYHHKHSASQNQTQHRHSPHHAGGYPPRAPPTSQTPSNRQHQSTPLARLSPSSELSAQQPRILTLHDISGKPLQTALLATTSSSGGVGKDPLHSNSERSLNSPVMSQLSGQSSASRKAVPQPPNSGNSGMGLTAEEIERLNSRPRTSSLVSTLDAVSSSSEAPHGPHQSHLAHLHHSPVIDTRRSSTTTDESGNDSFTCSEIEYDNSSLAGDKYKNESESRCADNGSTGSKPIPPPSYDGFDSSFRGSLSTLVASDDDLNGPMYRPPAGSPSATSALGWDYLLNWGPDFESLVGVFKDIAELPDGVNNRVPTSLRLQSAPKPSEEYV
ncbi:cadherin-related tumor suppressor [Chrysoperla carnea]|uniref:cadherin-related tumor suppressor n=1 Tax=Chrysoperla carnea TaxID=189513 RepID=UPI001D0956B9|nr:cadherin-related tumor suppressor [Chrysoperla carnea]